MKLDTHNLWIIVYPDGTMFGDTVYSKEGEAIYDCAIRFRTLLPVGCHAATLAAYLDTIRGCPEE
jgi:hypothetical protein